MHFDQQNFLHLPFQLLYILLLANRKCARCCEAGSELVLPDPFDEAIPRDAWHRDGIFPPDAALDCPATPKVSLLQHVLLDYSDSQFLTNLAAAGVC